MILSETIRVEGSASDVAPEGVPDLTIRIDLERVAWPRPRREVVELLGEKHPSLPVLILAEASDDARATRCVDRRSFFDDKDAILAVRRRSAISYP